MILVTGGTGFIGTHTVRALHDLGERSVVVSRSARELPSILDGTDTVVAQGDVGDLDSLLELGRQHDVTGIVHLAGYFAAGDGDDPIDAASRTLDGLFNVARAARQWGVRRVGVASTIGVYGGTDSTEPLHEDLPVALSAPHPIPRFKKIGELLTEQLTETTDVEFVDLRISATWGPLGHSDPFFPAPELVHAAVRGTAPDYSGLVSLDHAHPGDALDLCYVKDTGRAIALLQTADHLSHRTYNVASGRSTSNAEIVEAIEQVVPGANLELPAGEAGPRNHLDITRLHDDTGYVPDYDTERAVADYIDWLRAGNPA